jgi:lysozyme family protein
MANFDKALKKTLKWEGGYSNRASDKGGETYCGVSRLHNPNWLGWPIVDAHKPLKQGEKIKDDELDRKVASVYRLKYWNSVWAENIQNQDVAAFLFDWFVNSGYHAIEGVQVIVKEKKDGVMGTKTINAINRYPARELHQELIKARTQFVKNIVNNSPKQAVNLKGWLNRIDSFKTA